MQYIHVQKTTISFIRLGEIADTTVHNSILLLSSFVRGNEEKCCNLSLIKESSEASRVIGANGNFRPIHENFIRL